MWVRKLDISMLENWLWEAACSIRGPIDAPKYKDYIIPLIFYKRICDVYEDEIRKVAEELQISQDQTKKLVSKDRRLVRFYIPEECLWDDVRKVSEGDRREINLGIERDRKGELFEDNNDRRSENKRLQPESLLLCVCR